MWWWVGLWVALVLGAGAVLGLLGRRLWLKGSALITEMGAASERLTAVMAQLNAVDRPINDQRASPH